MRLQLCLSLKSDATFGRGEGLAGLVDEEIEHDAATGLPFVRGRVLKGLLVEECANLLFALQTASSPALPTLEKSSAWLFGRPGSDRESTARLHFGSALLPEQLRRAVSYRLDRDELKPADVLESLTSIRRQTAIDEVRAAPEKNSLRSMRVLLRQTSLCAWLDFAEDPGADDLALLAACVLSVRRGGIGRNRGRGRLSLGLLDEGENIAQRYFERFKQIIAGGQA